MFDDVISAGCSLTYGTELKDRNNRFANVVANHYNAKLTDYSCSGYSNEAISMNIINGIIGQLARKEINPVKTLAVVNWTYIDRLAYYSSEARGWFSMFFYRTNLSLAKQSAYTDETRSMFEEYIHPSEIQMYYGNHSDPLHLLYNYGSLIHRTQTFLNLHKIKYVFLHSSEHSMRLLELGTKQFDSMYTNVYSGEGFTNFKNILDDIEYDKFLKVPFVEFAGKSKLPFGPGGHPLDEAHEKYSKILIDFIEDTYDKKND